MHVIVVGCGRVGSQLATMLAGEDHDVVVIDKDAESFRRLGGEFNGATIKGLGFDEDVLEKAGIRTTDAVAAVTDLDNTNLMTAEVCRKIFSVRHVVSRLYNPGRERTYLQLSLDYVCGTTLVAENLLDKILSGHSHHIARLGAIEIVEFRANAEIEGKTVAEVERGRVMRISAVSRSRVDFVPEPTTVLHAGDILVAGISEDGLAKAERFMEV